MSQRAIFEGHKNVDSKKRLVGSCDKYFLIPVEVVRSSRPEVFLRNGFLKIYSKFTREHPCGSLISIKLQSNFIEITLRHGCSLVNLLHIFRTPFTKNTTEWLLLGCYEITCQIWQIFICFVNVSLTLMLIWKSLSFFWFCKCIIWTMKLTSLLSAFHLRNIAQTLTKFTVLWF